MARKLRHLDQADWYHLYNRGADRQDIFSLAGDHEFFERLIGEACAATGVEVHAYALMTNHFHFLVFDPAGALAKFMQLLCGRYALAYNSRTERTGPLFSGRYGSVPIHDDQHLLIEARYVERNPLAVVPPSALAAYRFSSLGAIVGRRAGPAWLCTDVIVPMVSASEYLSFVVDAHESDLREPIELPAAERPGVADLCHAASGICNVNITEAGGPVRNLALAVAFEMRLASSDELGRAFGISPSGVRMAARRGRILAATDDAMAGLKERIARDLCA